MHIGLICNEYPPAPHGGNGSLYSDLARGLSAAGHRVTVVGVYRQRELAGLWRDCEIATGLRVVRMRASAAFLRTRPRFWWERLRLARWLGRAHRHEPFDVIEAPDYEGWLRFGGPRGVPTVVRIGGSNLFFDTELNRPGNNFEHGVERASVARAGHLCAVSGYAARRTLELCGLASRPCPVIYNAVDPELFSPGKADAVEPGLVVFVNSLNPKKGIEQLLDAMNLIWSTHPLAHLAVLGQDTQTKRGGPSYLEQLRERVRPEFRSRVVFTGRLERERGMLDYLHRAQVCCYPSHMETFGIAPLEAMAVGKPTIFSRTGPGPEVIEDGVSGLLCDPFDPQDIAAKIVRLFDHPNLATELGRTARQRVLTRFNRATWIPRNVAFYQSCIERQRGQDIA